MSTFDEDMYQKWLYERRNRDVPDMSFETDEQQAEHLAAKKKEDALIHEPLLRYLEDLRLLNLKKSTLDPLE